MPKLKTRKAALKRYKITGKNNILRRHAFKGHLLMKKSNKQKRKLSQIIRVSNNDSKPIKLMLPYI
jgi:large subunit ribosomal protein L35